MPVCQKCGNEWSWKQTFKKMFTLGPGMKCPHCGEKQFLTTKTKKRSTFGAFFAPFIMLISMLFDFPPFITFVSLIMASLIPIGTAPFLTELSNEEEPQW